MTRGDKNYFDEMVPKCDLCLTVSGTATLHTAVHGVPMIVVYRGSPYLWHGFAKFLIHTRTFSLVNLLTENREHIVPEYVPWYGSNEPVAQKALEYLRDPKLLEEQRGKLRHVVETVSRPGASRNAASIAMDLLYNGKKSGK
jgi:lipid-A-disaccharide synthase